MELVPASLITTVVKNYAPQQVFLFGSRARGDAQNDSDYDLLVLLNPDQAQPHWRERAELRRQIGISSDIIFYPANKFEQYRDVVGSLAWTVNREGKEVYARGF